MECGRGVCQSRTLCYWFTLLVLSPGPLLQGTAEGFQGEHLVNSLSLIYMLCWLWRSYKHLTESGQMMFSHVAELLGAVSA